MSSDLDNLRDRVNAFCQERGYALSPEAENILNDIAQIKATTGHYYCPCRKVRNADTVCVCKPVRNGLVDVNGVCFCNLIVAGKG